MPLFTIPHLFSVLNCFRSNSSMNRLILVVNGKRIERPNVPHRKQIEVNDRWRSHDF